jgi:hypothetical protein
MLQVCTLGSHRCQTYHNTSLQFSYTSLIVHWIASVLILPALHVHQNLKTPREATQAQQFL